MFKFLVLLIAFIASATAVQLRDTEEEEILGITTAMLIAAGTKVGLAAVTGTAAGATGYTLGLF